MAWRLRGMRGMQLHQCRRRPRRRRQQPSELVCTGHSCAPTCTDRRTSAWQHSNGAVDANCCMAEHVGHSRAPCDGCAPLMCRRPERVMPAVTGVWRASAFSRLVFPLPLGPISCMLAGFLWVQEKGCARRGVHAAHAFHDASRDAAAAAAAVLTHPECRAVVAAQVRSRYPGHVLRPSAGRAQPCTPSKWRANMCGQQCKRGAGMRTASRRPGCAVPDTSSSTVFVLPFFSILEVTCSKVSVAAATEPWPGTADSSSDEELAGCACSALRPARCKLCQVRAWQLHPVFRVMIVAL